ncbi:MAG: protein TolQ [Rhodospirillaceae bacterium]|jgi:biopolymer transport protein TolQ|nr:protein TolQ [Rhodospirillaceae bacterium]MBT5239648.1 protein TolQ [Rhodospirillaceae bacterium]MBT5565538.1 protein TolQ [Rhodospirillaceae bacterium]MBT6089868.1 protein TolQ [Rhodospirillaceae bacterium]MBT7450682.1 protein TolQ [Rhodospirillaceae bacterium]
MEVESVGALGALATQSEFSLWGLFLQADVIVKSVMLFLAAASLWSWAIIFDKVLRIRSLTKRAEKFEEKFWSGSSLEELYDRVGPRPPDPMSSIFVAAMREWRRSSSKNKDGKPENIAGLGQRIDRVMRISLEREMDQLQSRMTFLASTGAVAPFVGLFGTVWGIMNTFTAIGASSDTSLATVAPGIAEALFATALGLVAAIPAVIAFNSISSDMNRYALRLENFAGEFGAILSRQLEERT